MMKALGVFLAVLCLASARTFPAVSLWSLDDLYQALNNPATNPEILPNLAQGLDTITANIYNGGIQSSIYLSLPIKQVVTFDDLSAALDDPNTHPALKPYLQKTLGQLIINGGPQSSIVLEIPAMNVNEWTLDQLFYASQDPTINPAIFPYLEYALNQASADINAGKVVNSIVVVTPPDIIVTPPKVSESSFTEVSFSTGPGLSTSTVDVVNTAPVVTTEAVSFDTTPLVLLTGEQLVYPTESQSFAENQKFIQVGPNGVQQVTQSIQNSPVNVQPLISNGDYQAVQGLNEFSWIIPSGNQDVLIQDSLITGPSNAVIQQLQQPIQGPLTSVNSYDGITLVDSSIIDGLSISNGVGQDYQDLSSLFALTTDPEEQQIFNFAVDAATGSNVIIDQYQQHLVPLNSVGSYVPDSVNQVVIQSNQPTLVPLLDTGSNVIIDQYQQPLVPLNSVGSYVPDSVNQVVIQSNQPTLVPLLDNYQQEQQIISVSSGPSGPLISNGVIQQSPPNIVDFINQVVQQPNNAFIPGVGPNGGVLEDQQQLISIYSSPVDSWVLSDGLVQQVQQPLQVPLNLVDEVNQIITPDSSFNPWSGPNTVIKDGQVISVSSAPSETWVISDNGFIDQIPQATQGPLNKVEVWIPNGVNQEFTQNIHLSSPGSPWFGPSNGLFQQDQQIISSPNGLLQQVQQFQGPLNSVGQFVPDVISQDVQFNPWFGPSNEQQIIQGSSLTFDNWPLPVEVNYQFQQQEIQPPVQVSIVDFPVQQSIQTSWVGPERFNQDVQNLVQLQPDQLFISGGFNEVQQQVIDTSSAQFQPDQLFISGGFNQGQQQIIDTSSAQFQPDQLFISGGFNQGQQQIIDTSSAQFQPDQLFISGGFNQGQQQIIDTSSAGVVSWVSPDGFLNQGPPSNQFQFPQVVSNEVTQLQQPIQGPSFGVNPWTGPGQVYQEFQTYEFPQANVGGWAVSNELDPLQTEVQIPIPPRFAYRAWA